MSMPNIDAVTSLHPTETSQSLKRELTHVPTHDVNVPGNARAFPEEYTVETETGLVRTETVKDVKGGGYRGLDPDKVHRAIERNKKQLEKERNGKTGFWSMLKGKLRL